MEPVLKIFYDSLKNDKKILGLRCKECGRVEFPPVPVCNSCSGMDMEWVDMRGEAELVSFTFNALGMAPYRMRPTVIGFGRTKEGNMFASTLLDVGYADQPALLERLRNGRVPLKMEIGSLCEEVDFPMYRLMEEDEK